MLKLIILLSSGIILIEVGKINYSSVHTFLMQSQFIIQPHLASFMLTSDDRAGLEEPTTRCLI